MVSIKPVRQYVPDGLAPFDAAQDKLVLHFLLTAEPTENAEETESVIS